MSNDYFTHDNELDRHTLGRAEQVNAIFQQIQGGFDKLPTPADVNQGRITYLQDTGTTDAYVVTMDPAITSYDEGLNLTMKAANANTGPATININALGPKAIKRYNGDPLEPQDIRAGMPVDLAYNGNDFLMKGAHGGEVAKAKKWASDTGTVESGLKGARGYAQDASASASSAAASASNAATSEGNAATSEGNAASSASAASTSEANAAASETKAGKWAEEAEDTEVESGKYSAKHHAAKAGGSASAAATSESGAASSASAASTSETNAASSASAAATSESNASDSASLAEDWATSLTAVSGGLKGARGYAQDAANYIGDAQGAIRWDTAQSLTAPQQQQARENIGFGTHKGAPTLMIEDS
ncbi:hypothetical protein [Fodinicurvata sediminis]|uniref:hypothetical protein n=1 Tax=Fodinicurvata sediminis TaxID=1121832 RepID=UPI0003B32FF6|nr:hypothetical protein [Fodinicurvata sediminis]